MAQHFWDEQWRDFQPDIVDPDEYYSAAKPADRAFMDLVGDVRGKEVLELGCGGGLFSVYFAKGGAVITAIDSSKEAVRATALQAEYNGVAESLRALEMDAKDLPSLGRRFDLVVGKFILHHIEPFDRFASILADLLVPGGRGVFLENNARNPVLMFMRSHLTGRFGIPKYGDEEESPFDPGEVESLRRVFSSVNITYPDFVCFRLAGSYLFKGNRAAESVLSRIDSWIYRHLPPLHKYSYRQIVVVHR